MSAVPYWRLSGFYFFYFAFVGAMSPFWGLYLQSLAFDAFQIGVLMSLLQVMRIFAPIIWGHIADRTGRRTAIVQLAALGSDNEPRHSPGVAFARRSWPRGSWLSQPL